MEIVEIFTIICYLLVVLFLSEIWYWLYMSVFPDMWRTPPLQRSIWGDSSSRFSLALCSYFWFVYFFFYDVFYNMCQFIHFCSKIFYTRINFIYERPERKWNKPQTVVLFFYLRSGISWTKNIFIGSSLYSLFLPSWHCLFVFNFLRIKWHK